MSPQLKVIIAGFVVIWLMGLFPPWVRLDLHGYQHSTLIERDLGHKFLFDGPRRNTRVNTTLLIKQWMVVTGVTVAIALLITRLQRKHLRRQRHFERHHDMQQAWDEIEGRGR